MSVAEIGKLPLEAVSARGRRRGGALGEALQGYAFLLPAFALLLLFHIVPVFYALFLSLFDARVFREMWSPGPFIGGGNYERLLQSGDFARSLANTLWYAGLAVPFGLVSALGCALLLHRKIWGQSGYRVTYFLPYITSTVAAAIVWRWIFQPRFGIVNAVLNAIGLPSQAWYDEPRGVFDLFGQFLGLQVPGLLSGPSLALVTVVIVTVWHSVGFDTVVFLAGLTTIPGELYDAARIDGASRTQLFRHVTLPLLTPTILFLVVISTIRSFQSFNFFYVISQGQPAVGSKVVTIYLYEQAFRSFNLGYAAAIGVVLFAILFTLTLLQFRASRSRVVYSD